MLRGIHARFIRQGQPCAVPTTFADDDLDYERWLGAHPAGYVVNCQAQSQGCLRHAPPLHLSYHFRRSRSRRNLDHRRTPQDLRRLDRRARCVGPYGHGWRSAAVRDLRTLRRYGGDRQHPERGAPPDRR